MAKYIIKCGEYYYYKRRVPSYLSEYEPKKFIKISLKTTDLNTAKERAIFQNQKIEEYWETLVHNPNIAKDLTRQEKAYKKAINIARAHGFKYKHQHEILEEGDITEIYERLSALAETGKAESKPHIDALLGGTTEPQITVSEALEKYWTFISDRLANKDANAIRKWENPRKRAINNFIEAIGNLPISEITRRHILEFRQFWMNRVASEGKNPETANKDFLHLKDVLNTVSLNLNLGVDFLPLFSNINMRALSNSRSSFETDYVQNVLLKTHNFEQLNEDAQAIIYFMADTGARLNEIVGLEKEDIVLHADIPYIHIRPNQTRDLKTKQSDRQIPLVGSSLYIAKRFPTGIKRYTNADSVSNLISSYLKNNSLLPSENHSLYSLRHTFKDRLRDIGAPEEVIDNLMGHQSRGPKYGRGHILETKLKWLNKIAFNTDDLQI